MTGPEPQLTPMMAQYRRIKSELPKDALAYFSRIIIERVSRRC